MSRTRIAYFFGGTGMLITVGVILDTMRQIETFLLAAPLRWLPQEGPHPRPQREPAAGRDRRSAELRKPCMKTRHCRCCDLARVGHRGIWAYKVFAEISSLLRSAVAAINDPFARFGPRRQSKFLLLGSPDFHSENLMNRARSLNLEHVSPLAS